METITQYFISPGRFAFNSASLIKFDGQYSYWGTWSKRWIHDPTLSKQYWIEEYLNPITEQEVQKIINEKEKIWQLKSRDWILSLFFHTSENSYLRSAGRYQDKGTTDILLNDKKGYSFYGWRKLPLLPGCRVEWCKPALKRCCMVKSLWGNDGFCDHLTIRERDQWRYRMKKTFLFQNLCQILFFRNGFMYLLFNWVSERVLLLRTTPHGRALPWMKPKKNPPEFLPGDWATQSPSLLRCHPKFLFAFCL